MLFIKCSLFFPFISTSFLYFSFKYSPLITRNPDVPHAGSHIVSLGCGSIISTIILIIFLGVLNCPFTPDFSSFESKYSYTSPLTSVLCSLSIIAYISSIASTIFESIRGVFTLKMASFIYLLYALFLSPCRFFIKGNTHSCIILYILCAGKS